MTDSFAARLAALREAIPVGKWELTGNIPIEAERLLVALVNAAPQIEALVRAAERHEENCEYAGVAGRCATCDALAALDET